LCNGDIGYIPDNRKKDAIESAAFLGRAGMHMGVNFFGFGALIVAVCVGGILITVLFTRKK